VNLEQRDVLSVVVAVSMGVVPVLIKLLERVPERRGGMADLPVADPVAEPVAERVVESIDTGIPPASTAQDKPPV